MGKQIEVKEEKGETFYRVWSSVVGDYITEWKTREEMILFINEEMERNKRLEIIKEYFCFPHQWMGRDNKIILAKENKLIDYQEWMKNLFGSENFDKEINTKYEEIMRKIKE